MVNENIITTEQVLLKLLKDNPKYVGEMENYFVSQIARDYFTVLLQLKKENKKITNDHIIIYGHEKNNQITSEQLNELDKISYDLKEFESYYKKLKQFFARKKLESEKLKEVLESVNRDFDSDSWIKLAKEIKNLVDLVDTSYSSLHNGFDLVFHHKQEMLKRQRGQGFYTTGDPYLDKIFTTGFLPGENTIIFARSSQGKSTYALNLFNRLINQFIVSAYFSLEMSEISQMDRLLAMRTRIPYTDIKPHFNGKYFEDDIISDEVMHSLQKQYNIIQELKHLYFDERSTLSINDLPNLIEKIQEKSNSKYFVLFLDLLTMLKEFSGDNKASKSEDAMNQISEISKNFGIHIVSIIQSKRKDNLSIKGISDLEKYRPTIEEIKNAGAFEERARNVLSVFQPYLYAQRHFQDDPILSVLENIIDVQVIKQSQGKPGGIAHYLFEPQYFTFTPYPEGNFFKSFQNFEYEKEEIINN